MPLPAKPDVIARCKDCGGNDHPKPLLAVNLPGEKIGFALCRACIKKRGVEVRDDG